MLKSKIIPFLLVVGFVFSGTQTVSASAGTKEIVDTSGGAISQKPYINVDDKNIDKVLTENPIVIVDFYADWCPPCRRFLPVFEQVAHEMQGKLIFGKLNVDYAQNSQKKYKASSIPTIIIFKNGKEVSRRTGGTDAQGLKAFINSVL